MAEQPALNRFYVASYAANDRDFPIVAVRLDPRVAGYRVPEDLSPHPDSKRYPNHVFTGSQPSNGDERVTHIYEILPSPWVPFTRYDDDLGPIQGRRRSVKNEGQVATLAADKRVTYEAREGSAIVYTEIEETWSIALDEDENSLFPIKERDIYDDRLGPIKEKRQLFVPTGEEKASLEYVAPNIIQTTYEPYNEFLSYKITTTYSLDGPIRREDFYEPLRGPVQRVSQAIYDNGGLVGSLNELNGLVTQISYTPINTLVVDKIVETYKVVGPILVGRSTNEVGQLTTITTTKRPAADYAPPTISATKSVEVARDDISTLTQRVTDIPSVFKASSFSIERPDNIPAKFRNLVPTKTTQETLAGTAEMPSLNSAGQIAKSETQQTNFVKRTSLTERDQTKLPQSLDQKSTNEFKQVVTIKETLQNGDTTDEPSATVDIQSEAIGDGNFIVTKSDTGTVFERKSVTIEKQDPLPAKFRVELPTTTSSQVVESTDDPNPVLADTETEFQLQKREEKLTNFTNLVATVSRKIDPFKNTLLGKIYTREFGGGLATVKEEITNSTETAPKTGFKVVSSEKENLGADQFLVRTVELDANPPALKGQQYDDTFNVPLPFTQTVVDSGAENIGNGLTELIPQDPFHTLQRTTTTDAINKLKAVNIQVAEIVNISLPDILESVEMIQSNSNGVGGASNFGDSYSVSITSSESSSIDITYKIKIGYSGPAKAIKYIYFVEQSGATITSILEKTNSNFWPILRPVSHTIEVFGASVSGNLQQSGSGSLSSPNGSVSRSYDINNSVSVVRLPPCLNKDINIRTSESTIRAYNPFPNIDESFDKELDLPTITPQVIPEKLDKTTPETFGIGKYLYSLSVQPYRYGLMKVEAVVVEVETSMV